MLRRLWLSLTLAACLFVLVGADASGAEERQVLLTIALNGKGTVTGGPRRIECRGSCTRSSTIWTFDVEAGSTFALKAYAARTWTFTGWKGACRGSKPRCVLRVRRTLRLAATFVTPSG